MNDAFVAVNRLLKANEDVYWLKAPIARERQDLSGRRRCSSRQADDAADPAEGRRPTGLSASTAVTRRPAERRAEAEAGAHRPVGSVRRLDAVGLDALAVRAVRVPVRGRVPADARRRQPEREVRRARLRRRRGARAEAARRGGERLFGRQPAAEDIPAEFRGWLGRVTAAKTVPAAEEVRRERRHDPRVGQLDLARPSPRPADQRRLVELVGRRRRASCRREVLRPRLDSRGARRHHRSARVRHGGAARGLLRQQPGVRAAARRGDEGREAGRLVRQREPLRSGWAWGQQYLQRRSRSSRRRSARAVVLFGPEITWRGQPHGTFKFLFNGIYYSTAQASGDGARTTAR